MTPSPCYCACTGAIDHRLAPLGPWIPLLGPPQLFPLYTHPLCRSCGPAAASFSDLSIIEVLIDARVKRTPRRDVRAVLTDLAKTQRPSRARINLSPSRGFPSQARETVRQYFYIIRGRATMFLRARIFFFSATREYVRRGKISK